MSGAAYDLAANKFRPEDPAALADEVRRLHKTGLTPRDISTALHLPPDFIINVLFGENQIDAGITSR
jgi:hypothetical protein